MAYSPFFDQCERTLRMSFDATTIAAFTGLARTCDTLPVGPLLAGLGSATCPDSSNDGGGPAHASDADGFGSWLDSSLDCSLAQLKVSSAAVDAACCPEEHDCSDGAGPETCTPECGGKLLNMITNCPQTLNLVFDGLGDGVYDGNAQIILQKRDQCNALPATDVVAAIIDKQAAGCMLEVEGVGETTIANAGCSDVGPRELCALVGEGTLHCAADFCPDDCAHAGECDLTCGFCPSGSDNGAGDGRRREQIVINTDDTCAPSSFEARTNAVNGACW
jgi:hypothetical protein